MVLCKNNNYCNSLVLYLFIYSESRFQYGTGKIAGLTVAYLGAGSAETQVKCITRYSLKRDVI